MNGLNAPELTHVFTFICKVIHIKIDKILEAKGKNLE